MPEQEERGYVLVVEDAASMRKVLEGMLKQLGFEVIGVADGVEAVQQMIKRKPLLVMLDLELPKLDGMGVLSLARKHESLKTVPIIACTGHAERDVVLTAIKAGITDYICKPIDRRVLMEKLEKYISPQEPGAQP